MAILPLQSPPMMGGDRQSLLLESLIHGLWDWNWATGLVAIGLETRTLTGLPPDVSTPIRVEDWFALIHPDDLDWFDACILETGDRKVFELDYRVRAANKLNWAWVHIRATVVRNAEGVAERVVGVHMDITARKNQEESLRLSEER
ncbi:MAG: PAS domain-containing protein, partial [Elsteraceae bacterium]